jgi:hypothetical protein
MFTNTMEQSTIGEVNSLLSQGLPCFYGTPKFEFVRCPSLMNVIREPSRKLLNRERSRSRCSPPRTL